MNKLNDLKGTAIAKTEDYKIIRKKWNSMHSRINTSKHYTNVTVCDEWYTLSNFYYWMIQQDGELTWDLDKDILGGNEYSPSTCILVPNHINQLFRKSTNSLGKGVVKNRNGFQAQIFHNNKREPLGTYKTPEQAAAVAESRRKQIIADYSVQYSNYPVLSEALKKHF